MTHQAASNKNETEVFFSSNPVDESSKVLEVKYDDIGISRSEESKSSKYMDGHYGETTKLSEPDVTTAYHGILLSTEQSELSSPAVNNETSILPSRQSTTIDKSIIAEISSTPAENHTTDITVMASEIIEGAKNSSSSSNTPANLKLEWLLGFYRYVLDAHFD